jgi:predicted enzyme related to lactoylglutathione lyase
MSNGRSLKRDPNMFEGLRTAIYPTPDLAKGKAWYQAVLGHAPYFDQPFYVGFNVGGFELGLVPDGTPSAAGVQTFWGVADAAATLKRLVGLGAVLHEDVKDVGDGILVASVKDPFGNVFGLIQNPHFNGIGSARPSADTSAAPDDAAT